MNPITTDLYDARLYRVEILETGETVEVSRSAAAGWIAYGKRSAGFSVGRDARTNWKSNLARMEIGDVMGYAMPAPEGFCDFARVERIA